MALLEAARGSKTTTLTPANAIESLTKALPYMISPSEAPMYFRSMKTQPTQLLHSYATDALATTAMPTVRAVNIEPTQDTVDNRALKQNMCQIAWEPYGITFWLERAAQLGGFAGISSEVRYALTKAMKNLLKSVEFALGSEQPKVTTASPEFAAFFDPTDGVNTNVTDLAAAAFTTVTEANVETKVQAIFDSGGGSDGDLDIYAGSADKLHLSNTLVGRANQVTVNANIRKVFTALDVYQSPVGNFNLKMTADRNFNDSVAIVDHAKYRIGLFYPPTPKALDAGQIHKGGAICMSWTAEYHVEAAMGGWKKDTTTV